MDCLCFTRQCSGGSHRWRDLKERPKHASPNCQIWDKDEEFGLDNSAVSRTTFPQYAL
jgi:hypothetical protein